MQAPVDADRFLPFHECMNFRHMGNYAAPGGVTRQDRLYRSCIFELTRPEDVERFESLGISAVYDFRAAAEREKRPLRLPVKRPPEVLELDISAGSMGNYLGGLGNTQPQISSIRERMANWYAEMPREGQASFRAMFDHLVDGEGAILLMCNTGKDRTGMAAGLILAALGVPAPSIARDYLLSSWAYRDVETAMKRYLSAHPLVTARSYMAEVFQVYDDYLHAFWNASDSLAGSLEAYLEQHLNLLPERRQRLRSRFLA